MSRGRSILPRIGIDILPPSQVIPYGDRRVGYMGAMAGPGISGFGIDPTMTSDGNMGRYQRRHGGMGRMGVGMDLNLPRGICFNFGPYGRGNAYRGLQFRSIYSRPSHRRVRMPWGVGGSAMDMGMGGLGYAGLSGRRGSRFGTFARRRPKVPPLHIGGHARSRAFGSGGGGPMGGYYEDDEFDEYDDWLDSYGSFGYESDYDDEEDEFYASEMYDPRERDMMFGSRRRQMGDYFDDYY